MARSAIIGACLIGLLFGTTGCIPSSKPLPTISVLPPRQIVGGTLPFREHWRAVEVSIGISRSGQSLVVTSGKVVFLEMEVTRGTRSRIQVLDDQGKALWNSPPVPFRELAVDSTQVYVRSNEGGWYYLHAYALDSGEWLWKKKLAPHIGYNFYSDGDTLYIHNIDNSEIYHLDPRTGAELGRVTLKTPEGFPLLGQLPGLDFYRTRRTLRVVDAASGRLLWETEIPLIWATRSCPLLVGETLLVGEMEIITALDVRTGHIKWTNLEDKERWFASNPAVMGGFVYALNYTARLMRIDVETGEEIGYLQFAPEESNPSRYQYWVAADTDTGMVFVAFDDSQELIALGP